MALGYPLIELDDVLELFDRQVERLPAWRGNRASTVERSVGVENGYG